MQRIYEEAIARKKDELIRLTGEIGNIDHQLEGIKSGNAAEETSRKGPSTKKRKSDESTKMKVTYTLDESSDDSPMYAEAPLTRKKTVHNTDDDTDDDTRNDGSLMYAEGPLTRKKTVPTMGGDDTGDDDSSMYAEGPLTRKKMVPETGGDDTVPETGARKKTVPTMGGDDTGDDDSSMYAEGRLTRKKTAPETGGGDTVPRTGGDDTVDGDSSSSSDKSN
jgi:hypothetical protein